MICAVRSTRIHLRQVTLRVFLAGFAGLFFEEKNQCSTLLSGVCEKFTH
jgi:hypothetical protein